MAAYRRVDDLTVTCRLTACTPGSAPGPTLGIEYRKTLPFYRQLKGGNFLRHGVVKIIAVPFLPAWTCRLVDSALDDVPNFVIPQATGHL